MSRRMVAKMTSQVPSAKDIRALLDAAVRAPNHFLTQPWRFIVLSGSALDELGDAMSRRIAEEHAGDPDLEQKLEMERLRPHRAPVIIVVVYVKSLHPKAIEMEDRYSVGAAIENLLLAAHSMGLGAYWRTGPAARDRHTRSYLEINEDEEIAAFVYLGFATEERLPTGRESADSRTEWRGSIG